MIDIDLGMHEFFYAAYRLLLSREIEESLRSDVKDWSVAPSALYQFLHDLLNSHEFCTRAHPLEHVAPFSSWLMVWSEGLDPSVREAALVAAYTALIGYAQTLVESYALPSQPSEGGHFGAVALRIREGENDLLIFNLDRERRVRLIHDGEERLTVSPLCCGQIDLDQVPHADGLVLSELVFLGPAGQIEDRVALLSPAHGRDAESAVPTVSLAEWVSGDDVKLLLQRPFGLGFRGLHNEKFICPDGHNVLWHDHTLAAGRSFSREDDCHIAYGRELIDYYSGKFNMPSGISLPICAATKELVRSPAVTFHGPNNGPTIAGLLDCGMDRQRGGRYLVDDVYRREEDINIVRANIHLGDAFLSDWLQTLVSTCREIRGEVFGIEINAYYETKVAKHATSLESLLRFIFREIMEAVANGQGILLIPNQWFRVLWGEEVVTHDLIELLYTEPRKQRSVRNLGDVVLDLGAKTDIRDAEQVYEHCRALAARAAQQNTSNKINLIGFFDGTGLGNNSFMFHRAFESFLQPLARSANAETGHVRSYARNTHQAGPSRTVICGNPNDVIRLYMRAIEATAPQDYRIGFFLWETSKAPSAFANGCRFVNEIWVPTEFLKPVFEEIAPDTAVRVVGKHIPRGVSVPVRLRHRLGIKPEAKIFTCIGEFGSSIERKNFLGAVRAFKRAVTRDDEAVMVLKLRSVEPGHWSNRQGHWEQVCAEIRNDPRFRVLVVRYSLAEYWGMLEESDAFVSLHRGEGFGYGLAHAMLVGKPVVTVSWSGEADFCTPDTAFVVDHDLVPVEPWMMNVSSYVGVWAEARIESAAAQIRRVLDDAQAVQARTAAGRALVGSLYSAATFRANVKRALLSGV